jgi:hypothetical protein
MIEEIDLAYIAGFIDGEGCITIVRINKTGTKELLWHRPVLAIYNTNRDILNWIQVVLGVGSVCSASLGPPARKQCWRYSVSNSAAIRVIEKVMPYLKVKKLQAAILLRYKDTYPSVGWRLSTPGSVTDTREILKTQIQDLNKKGPSIEMEVN